MKNIKYTGQAILSNGKSITRLFATDKAFSNWADRMYRKDNDCTVYQYESFSDKLVSTWHA